MNYNLKQQNSSEFDISLCYEEVNGGEAKKMRTQISDFWNDLYVEDECVQANINFEKDAPYFFKAKILGDRNMEQTFHIYLTDESGSKMQYIKDFTIFNRDMWQDFEIVFTPMLSGLNTILFKKDRNLEHAERYSSSVIVYEQLDKVQNIITEISNLIIPKLGIQTRPGSVFCINKEQIIIGRTGYYEFKNGIITVDFFGVPLSGKVSDIEDILAAAKSEKKSICIFDKNRERGENGKITPFILDYLYTDKLYRK